MTLNINNSIKTLSLVSIILLVQACAKIDSNETPAAPATTGSTSNGALVVQADCDGDGLTDAEEILLGSNPSNTDTDNDGLNDYQEVKVYNTNPILMDTDRDGLTDGAEVNTFHTIPTLYDTDAGGTADGTEVSKGKNPLLSSDDLPATSVNSCVIVP